MTKNIARRNKLRETARKLSPSLLISLKNTMADLCLVCILPSKLLKDKIMEKGKPPHLINLDHRIRASIKTLWPIMFQDIQIRMDMLEIHSLTLGLRHMRQTRGI